ncbi:deoxyribodipyrimidine photo-lyase [Deinococcus sp. HSC-46F16]|uniref:deoxyribodipyrimidine photo-lyase n=1 Tax=Deinococcus sp. HSC-46F16 TaxID=2910968 RepID=UPI0020A10EE0|nr:deoxyribodipyrimidine photo-lyase [Deinococcus sp. HSC-46F16]MCP2015216.1 deoxyribodipyrimidine photo-lyase [Deinococcus sp. HSC-46F16]
MIQPERVEWLRPGEPGRGGFVLLWVQSSVRTVGNHALEYAALEARRLGVPLAAVFALNPAYPEANARHFQYLLEGLRNLRAGLSARGIPLAIRIGDPPQEVWQAARGASLVVTDRGYLRPGRQWRASLAERLEMPFVQIESDAVVPVRLVSSRQEVGARTLRPKLHRVLERFLVPVEVQEGAQGHPDWDPGLDVSDPALTVRALGVDNSVPPGEEEGGEVRALARLEHFVTRLLPGYDSGRRDPNVDGGSRLSAYLHYGHLSPLTAALAAREHSDGGPGLDTFLEEMIVRRELSFNFCEFNPDYDRYEGLPRWARENLEAHAADPRPHLYTREQLDAAQTHDRYWNAAHTEMVRTGRMHNAMRMYWGKKILEWSATPQEAYATTLWLNNRYQLDGRDANSYASVGWIFGLHDRPWARRPIFGTVRYLAASGLNRKFDAEAYARRWS